MIFLSLAFIGATGSGAVADAIHKLPDLVRKAEPEVAASAQPLTQDERQSLRTAIARCWNIPADGDAKDIAVTLGFSLNRGGKVQGGFDLLESNSDDEEAIHIAFQAARRAVLRCQVAGYDLPSEKYEHWQDVRMTFDARKARLK